MMSKRVPGKWKVHTVYDYSPQIVVADGEMAGAPICDMFDERDHKPLAGFVEGTAEFIAAAPATASERDRLKALVLKLLGMMEDMTSEGEGAAIWCLEDVQEAIAQAKVELNAQP